MKKKGMIAAVAMIAAFIAVMPTAVTANAVSAAEIQEETEELRKDSTDGVYNHLKYTLQLPAWIMQMMIRMLNL